MPMNVHCTSKPSPAAYKKMLAGMYRGNNCFRDSLSSLFQLVTSPQGAFGRRSRRLAVTVSDDHGRVLAFGLFIGADMMPEILQIGFFEARPGCLAAVEKLVKVAEDTAMKWGAATIVAGMNGHVNYGLGFLVDHFDQTPCFGAGFNPPSTPDYFRCLGFNEDRLVSYQYDIDAISMAREQPLLARLQRKFTFRKADFSRLQDEIHLYTQLNNRCFGDHPLYFHRNADEDYELFTPFRWFLNEENLLIAECDGRPVAFVLWYPDFHELLRPGETLGLMALLRYRLLKRSMSRLKIAEIGVVQEFQGSGVMLGLFHLCFTLAKGRFQTCESGWIFDANEKSKNICMRWQPEPAKNFAVFSRKLS